MTAVYVTVQGVIGTDPKRAAWNGRHLLSFRMVCNERKYDSAAGNWVDVHSSWLGVSCFGDLAHNVDASVRKGDRVIVHGRLRVKDYLGQDGARRTAVDVQADSVGPDLRFGVAPLRPHRRRPDPEEQLGEQADQLQRQLDDEPRPSVAELVAGRVSEVDDEPDDFETFEDDLGGAAADGPGVLASASS